MKKLLLLLLLIPNLVMGVEWTKMTNSIYSNRESFEIVNSNSRFRLLTYTNYKKQSLRALNEYDCLEKRYRNLTATLFSERDLKGIVVATEGIQDWEYLIKGTDHAFLISKRCEIHKKFGNLKY